MVTICGWGRVQGPVRGESPPRGDTRGTSPWSAATNWAAARPAGITIYSQGWSVIPSYLGSGGEQFVGQGQLLLQLQLNLHIVLHLKWWRMQDIVFTGGVLFCFRFSAK